MDPADARDASVAFADECHDAGVSPERARRRTMASAGARDAVVGLAVADKLFLFVAESPGVAATGERARDGASATTRRDPRLARVPVGRSATLSICGCAMASAGDADAVVASAGADASDVVAGATTAAAIACEETRSGAGLAGPGTRLVRASFASHAGVTLES